ncbi:hypothetical protein LTR95_001735 [Oleoguttula sp. CCFEE 5521]
MGAPAEAPTRFPCWCRATYSWGGESKKDLGIIEGDLIEALNAGDGLWWTGRLRRDPRAIGMFPSNFVNVLDEGFQPGVPSRQSTPVQAAAPTAKNKTFRKPFQAYEKTGAQDTARIEANKVAERPAEKKSAFKPFSSMRTAQAPASVPIQAENHAYRAPNPRGSGSRMSKAGTPLPSRRPSASPTPTPGYAQQRSYEQSSRRGTYQDDYDQGTYLRYGPQDDYRASSPYPTQRTPSPNPMRSASPMPMSRAASPMPIQRATSPMPMSRAASPAPPRSRSPLPNSYHDGSAFPQLLPQSSRAPSPDPFYTGHHGSRAPSPAPPQDPWQDARTHSPAPPHGYTSYSRAPSPAPSFGYEPYQRPSDASFGDDVGSSPPPPPPVHRVAYHPSRAPSPAPMQHHDQGYDRGGSRTPIPTSAGGASHATPSPLRDAMNDVMSSLHDMSMYQSSPPPPVDSHATAQSHNAQMWSPDGFEHVRTQSRNEMRAHSSLGFASGGEYEADDRTSSLPSTRDGPVPQLATYAERMEHQLQHRASVASYSGHAPAPPLKGSQYAATRPTTATSHSSNESASSHHSMHSQQKHPHLRQRKSAYELGRERLNRTYTTKTTATASSSATQSSASTALTDHSLMSGYSAGGFSATSAGSLARRKFGLGSMKGTHRPINLRETKTTGDMNSSTRSVAASSASGGSGPSYHESHASADGPLPTPRADWTKDPTESAGILGGLSSAPKSKKSGFFKKMIESAKTTAKTGAANARSTIGSANGSRPGSRAGSPTKSLLNGNGPTGIAGGLASRPQSAAGGAARDMGMGGGEWMQVRRDVNRSNTLSRREREERAERCEILALPVLSPIEQLHEMAEGDEGLDGMPVHEPTDFQLSNLALVDKSVRFINSIPPMINAAALAQSYICRPHRSDVARLRAIFTWVAERVTWEEDYEGHSDSRRVVQTKRGCSNEIAMLVRDMCNAVGLHAEVVQGFLKSPGESTTIDDLAQSNHYWNAVIVDGEWRMLDCALASPTNPKRALYSSASAQVAEPWYFLARPSEICYTHIPTLATQQHIVPPIDIDVLLALPCTGPAYFRHSVELTDFSTSALHLENLEMSQFACHVPADTELVAEVSSRTLAQDPEGDVYDSPELTITPALTQPSWTGTRKLVKIKALIPATAGSTTTLRVYAGKRGLMHSIKDNPHALAFALPLTHSGAQNPPYEFVVRHPTPHAQRRDLYIAQPQCRTLGANHTFVFHIRQWPSSLSHFSPDTWAAPIRHPDTSTIPVRPGSAMSTLSTTSSVPLSNPSTASSGESMTAAQQRPVKLALQSPSQKILRLTRRAETEGEEGWGSGWEAVVKVSEKGIWRGLVLADRSARWCVFAEWECV